MANDIVKQVGNALTSMRDKLSVTLPGHIPAEKFIRTVTTALSTSPDLQRACMNKEARQSLYVSAQKCAADGLLPDGREAAFVVMGGKIQYMPMAQGLMKAMRNTGEVASIAARVVYTNDRFLFRMGDDEVIEHEPAPLDADPGDPIGAYCVIKLKDGTAIREVMRKKEIEKVRAVSRAKNAGTWTTWWEEMARKTVLRRAYKYAPKSADVDQMLAQDGDTYEAVEQQQAVERGRNAAAILGGVQQQVEQQATPHDPETGEVLEAEYTTVEDDGPDEPLPADGSDAPAEAEGQAEQPADDELREGEAEAADGPSIAALAVDPVKNEKGDTHWQKTYVALKDSASKLAPADLAAWKGINADVIEGVRANCSAWWPSLENILKHLEKQAKGAA